MRLPVTLAATTSDRAQPLGPRSSAVPGRTRAGLTTTWGCDDCATWGVGGVVAGGVVVGGVVVGGVVVGGVVGGVYVFV